ncbi:hypothetical protein [Bacillus marinisedimentorum]|nr:hypothetical protein [Bacillus marinisedimentorum]
MQHLHPVRSFVTGLHDRMLFEAMDIDSVPESFRAIWLPALLMSFNS